jgi:hypothetical protein
MFMAILYFTIKRWTEKVSAYPLVLICLLLCGIGIIYPILFPPAFALVVAKAIGMLLSWPKPGGRVIYRQILPLCVVLLIAAIVTFVHYEFVTQDRVSGGVRLSHLTALMRKILDFFIVTGPLLAGLGLSFSRCWKERPSATLVLVLGALASFALYIVFRLNSQQWTSEYKFIFTAAVCLAPFPPLALENLMDRLGRRALPVFTVIAIMFVFPLAHKVYLRRPHWLPSNRPVVDMQHFDLRLDPSEKFSKLCRTIRLRTPITSIILAEEYQIHFPTLTRRQLYVPLHDTARPGVNTGSDLQLKVTRGYDAQLIDERRSTLIDLFYSDSKGQRAKAFDQVLELNRPLVIVIDQGRHSSLLKWLTKEGKGNSLYRGNGFVVWLVEPISKKTNV